MNKKQKADFMAKFTELMAEVGATMPLNPPFDGYYINWTGHRLRCMPYAENGPWIACQWQTGKPELLEAYLKLKGWNSLAPETPESIAAYDVYRESERLEVEQIKAKGLPYNNPYSLKWNHHGFEACPCPIESLRQGLTPLLKQKESLINAD
jgi:hypothetical protein